MLGNQFIKFVGVGGLSTFNHYVLMIALVELFSVDPVIASVFGFTVGAITSYILNYFFTFKCASSHRQAAIKFICVAVLGACVNTLIMHVLIEYAQLLYIFAQVIATGLVLVLNFFASKYWSFA
ncbi:GtrA family protein [Saccharophagus degradans]|uniref:GtrA family protein n=1 Tax=Saccharophagus degradans TaxID=86304 RepID=A0AAW7XBL3_9GAMM|nr:GtrA family protein [Saccharophagus degradans]MBU2986836.1 GtrA family protein [Saccharophagus degradans]MDO6424854.1 GtrA family protein [Saccharophagus degradans]MDO6606642.1 GtrA family protein [Saccharophagus degradans]